MVWGFPDTTVIFPATMSCPDIEGAGPPGIPRRSGMIHRATSPPLPCSPDRDAPGRCFLLLAGRMFNAAGYGSRGCAASSSTGTGLTAHAGARCPTRRPEHLRSGHQSTDRSSHSTTSGGTTASTTNPRCFASGINSTCACGVNAPNTPANSSA